MTDEHHADRRSFLKTGAIAGTALVAGASAMAQQAAIDTDASRKRPTEGDIAILRFLSAVEQIESDLWQQYNELGGIQDSEVPGGSGSTLYTNALNNLDADMSQYIHDNTEDEFSHHAFLNAYLKSINPKLQVDLSPFATLTGSHATGAADPTTTKRLTNLMQLTVDTTWWTRYRSRTHNPDLPEFPPFVFPPVVPTLNTGMHPAIPRNDTDLAPNDQIQAIANTAAFHFGTIEQGGSSLYPTLALRVTHPVVLRILLSIGPTETSHFQTWHDKAGNALSSPNNVTFGTLTFNVSTSGEDLQTNLIMPEPTFFLNRKFPVCSIIRPVSTKPSIFGAVQAVNGLAASGLFLGHPDADGFLKFVSGLAKEADEATRRCDED
jgi:hypothetical protein